MEQKAQRLVKEDRTHYLQDNRDASFVLPYIELVENHANVRVTNWTGLTTGPSICINQGGFIFSAELRVEEARLIAQALLMAADDAEKAIEAAYAQDEVAA